MTGFYDRFLNQIFNDLKFLKMYTMCLNFFDIYKEVYSMPKLFGYLTTGEYDAENTYCKENVLL